MTVELTVELLVTISAGIIFIYLQFVNDTKSRKWIARWASLPVRERYLDTLTALLNWLDKRIGKPWSWHSIGVCLTLAFFYPLLLALLGWVISNKPFMLGEVVVLDSLAAWRRYGLAGFLVAYPYAVYRLVKLARYLETWLERHLANMPRHLAWLLRGLFFCLLFIVTFRSLDSNIWFSLVFAVVGAGAAVAAFALAFAALASAPAFAVVAFVVATVTVTVTLYVVAVYVVAGSNSELSTIFLIFL